MLTMRASFEPSTLDREARTVELVWSVGHKGLRRSYWDGDYYEELSMDPAHVRMDRLNSRAPVLAVHNQWSLDAVHGVVERAWIKNGEGRALVRFAKAEDDADADKTFRKIADGILVNVSVGYTVYRYEIIETADNKIPTYRATDWEPAELSIVPIGFDPSAQVRSQEPAKQHAVEIIRRAPVAGGDGGQSPTEQTRKPEDADMPDENKPVEKTAPTAEQVRAAEQQAAEQARIAERQRANEIRMATRKAGLGDDVADKLIADGVELDKARAFIIDELAKRDVTTNTQQHNRVNVVDDERDKWMRGAGAWLIQKAGVGDSMKRAGVEVGDAGEFRGLTLLDLARASLERNGVNTRGMDKMSLVATALTHRSGGYQTISDFDVLLETTINKVLQAAFAIAPDTWRRFCRVGSVSDFRAHNRYMMGSFGPLDSVGEVQEYKNKAIPDGEKQSITAATKGNIIGLSRQAIINDDMDAFSRLPTMLGRAAGLSIETDVYAALALNSGLGPTLSDGNPLFHNRTNRNNIATGAALSAANIDLDRQVMAQMKDISGNDYVDLLPAILLVPLSLGSTARTINSAEYDPDAVANKSQLKPNTVRGLFRDVVDTPRLTGTRRYLFSDPNIAAALEVAFLDGQQSPVLETQDGWRVDGVEWKVRIDYAVGGVGYYGAVTNAGG